MKKIFLIPLLTLFSCVLAWGENVAKIGDVEYETLQAALDAADANATITLLSDAAGDITISKNITIAGDKKITGNIEIVASEVTLTLAGVTIDVTGSDAIVHLGKTLNVVVAGGTTNAIYAKSTYCDCFYGTSNGRLSISGNGNLLVEGYEALHSTIVNISAENATFKASQAVFASDVNDYTLTAGSYGMTPAQYVDLTSYIITKPAELYVVSAPAADVVAYNSNKLTTYTTLSAAVTAASAADVIYLYKNDESAVTVAENITIATNGHTTNLSAGAEFSRVDMGQNVVFTDNAIAAFLMADGEASLTVSEDADIASAGPILVNGTKTLTIPAGKKILYQRQGVDANILVNAGAKLTILGNGSVEPVSGTEMETNENMANQTGCWAIRVDGELVVGVEGADQPHFVSTAGRISGVNDFHGAPIYITENGKATINNIDIHAAQAAFWNAGETTINGGEFISVSSSQSGLGKYSYALQNYGKMVINDIHVQGTHGGLGCQNFHTNADIVNGFAEAANTVIYGGTFETVHGKNFITGADNAKDNYYAMYVSNFGIVNVYGGKFKVQTPSAGSGRVVLIGNNDAYNSYGVVNFYGGMYAEKAYVTKKKNTESAFPPSIPLTSAWYSAFEVKDANNAYAPLPAGYDYVEITSGEDYDAGYRWQVVCENPNTDAIDEDKLSEPTIPWQQNTTWASDVVPVENTVVTIPVDATVVVSKDEADTAAVAEQVFVNQGANLIVETGTSLAVGDGGVNIAHGGSVTVEPGAIVKIGAAGVITAEEDALVIESNDDVQGVLLYDPTVPQSENTQPKATVKLTTKSKQIGANSYVFERFAIPTINGTKTSYSIEGGIPTTGLYNDASSFLQAVWGWNHETQDWYQLNRFKDMEPYKGYQLTNNTANGGLVYVFEGNLVGNANGNYNFVENGFHFFGNSYTADINIKTFLASLGSEVEKTVWVYDPYDKNFKTITARLSNGRVKYGNDEAIKDIRSMQAFLMYLSDGTSGTATVDYESAIWGNPKYNPSASPAPARERETVAEDWATIKVASANGLKDEFILLQSEEFSSAFENGADASKFMNKENINLYATTNVGNLAMVATDNIDRTVLAFAAGEATEYTISFEGVEGNEFTLRDIVTGAMVSMTEGATYTFTQEANTTNAARFEILGSAKLPTAIENVEAEAKAHGIYTIAGQFVGNDFNALSAGVYVVNGVKIVK